MKIRDELTQVEGRDKSIRIESRDRQSRVESRDDLAQEIVEIDQLEIKV